MDAQTKRMRSIAVLQRMRSEKGLGCCVLYGWFVSCGKATWEVTSCQMSQSQHSVTVVLVCSPTWPRQRLGEMEPK